MKRFLQSVISTGKALVAHHRLIFLVSVSVGILGIFGKKLLRQGDDDPVANLTKKHCETILPLLLPNRRFKVIKADQTGVILVSKKEGAATLTLFVDLHASQRFIGGEINKGGITQELVPLTSFDEVPTAEITRIIKLLATLL